MPERAGQNDIISTEDKEFIRLLTAMPTDVKLLAKGFILGVKTAGGQPQASRTAREKAAPAGSGREVI